jgi:chromosome partitioning protein
MPVIATAMMKGGVGKTTTVINLAAALKKRGWSVLLIDSDPQASLTQALAIPTDLEYNLYTEYKKEIMGKTSDLGTVIVDTKSGLPLIPSSPSLSNLESELVSRISREKTLRKKMLPKILPRYDFIFIDCPPSFGLATINALVASDFLLVPLQGEFLSGKGLESFLLQVESLKEALSLDLRLTGFLLTRYSPRRKMNEETRIQLEKNYPGLLYSTFIHSDVRLASAQKQGLDIFSYSPHSVGATDYQNLSLEFLRSISPPVPVQNFLATEESLTKQTDHYS